MRALAENLKQAIADSGLNEAEAAARIGISADRLYNYTNDRREPDFEMFVRMCELLEVTPNELLGWPSPAHVRKDVLVRLLLETPREMEKIGLAVTPELVAQCVAEIYARGMKILKGEPWPEKLIEFAIVQTVAEERRRLFGEGETGSGATRNRPDPADRPADPASALKGPKGPR